MTRSKLLQDFQRDGFAVLLRFLNETALQALTEACSPIDHDYGVRNVLARFPAIRAALPWHDIRDVLHQIDLRDAVAVRSLFFNKNAEHNWLVPWHQDTSLCVREKSATSGFSKWTQKSGMHHVEPPAELLQSMCTLRFAIDDAPLDNGALRVIPGSHLLGKLSAADIADASMHRTQIHCTMQRGDVLLMRPLLLHASDKALHAQNRRVLHLEMSASILPPPMQWAEISTAE
ncbi:MAG: phytanoyl-CoA dioxygenase family protein [Burkholderiales bacterium]|nr:phytanoyl-CoA dioxygenase family protein [Burkholderiales bacterium]